MLLLMIERGMLIDAVLSADTGMEFPEMYVRLQKLDDYLYRKRGLHITTLRHPKGFEWMMFEEPKQKPSCLANRQWLGIPAMETAGTESRCAGVYEQYKALRQDMIAYQTAKQNVDRILGTELLEPEQTQKHCSPTVSRIRDTPLCYLNAPQKTVFTSVL